MNRFGWAFVFAFLSVTPAAAEMWQYTDESGALNFTNEYTNIPVKLRGSAQKHTLKSNEEIAEARRLRIDTFSPEEAKRALQNGELTEEEVSRLVVKGSLRTSDAGDAIRFAVSPQQAAEKKRLAEEAAKANDGGAFGDMTAEQMKAVSGTQMSELKKFTSRIRLSPNFEYAMYGEAALILIVMIGLPFALRSYRDEGTRRIIRASFFFSFLIVSATANILFFKTEVTEALNLGAALPSHPTAVTPPAGQPAHLVAP